MRQEGILLALVESMDFVNEQDRPATGLAGLSSTCTTSPAFNVTFETSTLTLGAVNFVMASVEEAPLSVNAESSTVTLARLAGSTVSMANVAEDVAALSLPARSVAVTLTVFPAPWPRVAIFDPVNA